VFRHLSHLTHSRSHLELTRPGLINRILVHSVGVWPVATVCRSGGLRSRKAGTRGGRLMVAPPRSRHSSSSEPQVTQVPYWLEARAVARGVNTSSTATGAGLSAVMPIVVVMAMMTLPLLLMAAGTRRSGEVVGDAQVVGEAGPEASHSSSWHAARLGAQTPHVGHSTT